MQESLYFSLDLKFLEVKRLSARIHQHLSSLSTFSLIHQNQKGALHDDKYTLGPVAEVLLRKMQEKLS